MKHRIAPLIGGILAASALSLSAQTFTQDDTPPPGINTFSRVDSFIVGGANSTGAGDDGILFNNVVGGGVPDPYLINPVGIFVTEVTTSAGTFTAYDFCAELFVGPNTSASYSVSQGFGSLNASQQVLVAKLFSNTLNSFITAATRPEKDVISAAIQIAFWEIIEDQVDLSNPSLDENGLSPGNLSIAGFSGSYTGATKDAMELAENYLGNVNSWSDQGGLNYYYAENGTDQDRFWVTTQAIPEPSTAFLGLLSLGFLLRRKRN